VVGTVLVSRQLVFEHLFGVDERRQRDDPELDERYVDEDMAGVRAWLTGGFFCLALGRVYGVEAFSRDKVFAAVARYVIRTSIVVYRFTAGQRS